MTNVFGPSWMAKSFQIGKAVVSCHCYGSNMYHVRIAKQRRGWFRMLTPVHWTLLSLLGVLESLLVVMQKKKNQGISSTFYLVSLTDTNLSTNLYSGVTKMWFAIPNSPINDMFLCKISIYEGFLKITISQFF